ncbi:hypothetical protein ACIPV2_04725 [Microbacterium sp. NPDC089987]|uniref:hypothetical protein n=1 Tax=Microbacterium sp. NPDC089987 TaxID=3364202 RepID=UPI00380EDA8F
MRRRIDIAEAGRMLLTREHLRNNGVTERQLRDALRAQSLRRVHRGSYVRAKDWTSLWWEGQHLLKVLAVKAASQGKGPLFTHASAAVLWGLPMYRMGDQPVQIVVDGTRHSRVIAGVVRRDMRLDDGDITEIEGFRVTSLIRTTFDVARTAAFDTAVSCTDAALRQRAVSGQVVDAEADALWRAEALRLARPGLRGVRQAREVLDFADGRSQLPGESVSRVRLHQLGFSKYELQVPVTGAQGDRYWVDFAFLRARRFGEFDGKGKYLDPDLRTAASSDEAVAEKRREDDIRGVTGWGFARWGYEHIRTPDAFGTRLAAFGIRPPG